jgi:hypothetical protein
LGAFLLAASPPCLAPVTASPGAEPDSLPLIEGEGWGSEQGGLQLGLFLDGDKSELAYGDTVAIAVRARNTSGEPLEVRYAASDSQCRVDALPDRRLSLMVLPRGQEPQVLRLEPGEEKPVPGLALRVRLGQPGDRERDAAAVEPAASMALLPGRYTVEFPNPIWLADPTGSGPYTAHPARPGLARFTVRDDAANPWIVERIVYDASGRPSLPREMPADPGAVVTQLDGPPGIAGEGLPISWGEMVNGLQAGLRREEWEGPATGPKRPCTITFGFYVRNCTNRALRARLPDLGDAAWGSSDWSPDIEDNDGNRVDMTRRVDTTGFRGSRDYLLAPGECVRVGCPWLQLGDKAAPGADQDSVALVEPGRFTAACVETAFWAAGWRLSMALPTGRVVFDVASGDLGRKRQAPEPGGLGLLLRWMRGALRYGEGSNP